MYRKQLLFNHIFCREKCTWLYVASSQESSFQCYTSKMTYMSTHTSVTPQVPPSLWQHIAAACPPLPPEALGPSEVESNNSRQEAKIWVKIGLRSESRVLMREGIPSPNEPMSFCWWIWRERSRRREGGGS